MGLIKFTVFGEPVAQGRPRFARRGNFVTTYDPDKSREYKDTVYSVAMGYLPEKPLEGPLEITIDAFFTLPKSAKKADKALAESETLYHIKRGDVDNIAKGVMDSINGLIYKDDSHISRLIITKKYTMNLPRIEVSICSLD